MLLLLWHHLLLPLSRSQALYVKLSTLGTLGLSSSLLAILGGQRRNRERQDSWGRRHSLALAQSKLRGAHPMAARHKEQWASRTLQHHMSIPTVRATEREKGWRFLTDSIYQALTDLGEQTPLRTGTTPVAVRACLVNLLIKCKNGRNRERNTTSLPFFPCGYFPLNQPYLWHCNNTFQT